jgi:uncharacterized protein (TIGR03435 family)
LEVAEFEIATIKPTAADSNISLNVYPNGRVKFTCWALRDLIHAAYGLSYWQVKGGPAWIENDFYDVEAKPPDPNDGDPAYNVHHDKWTLDDPKLRTMLQALLEDRFQLKTHLIVKDGPIYVLERSDGILSLTPATHTTETGGLGGIGFTRGVRLLNNTMPQLAAFLSKHILYETVIDKTGLTGSYDFQSKTVLTDEDLRTIDSTLFLPDVKEMGLKLTRSTGPVTTLVIDQAAHPSPN